MTGRAAPAALVVMTTTSLDMGLVERFAGQVFGYYTGGMIAYMIDIPVIAPGCSRPPAHGPGTSAELAERARLQVRHLASATR